MIISGPPIENTAPDGDHFLSLDGVGPTFACLRWFAWEHLPPGVLRETSRMYAGLAVQLYVGRAQHQDPDDQWAADEQLQVALHRLLESKDAAVRAQVAAAAEQGRLREQQPLEWAQVLRTWAEADDPGELDFGGVRVPERMQQVLIDGVDGVPMVLDRTVPGESP